EELAAEGDTWYRRFGTVQTGAAAWASRRRDGAPQERNPGSRISRLRRSIRATGSLRRRARLARSEPSVERVALGGHLDEELRRLEARAVLLLKRLHHIDEALGAEHVDPGERPARVGCEAEAEDRAHVRLAHVGEHALFEAARGLERHDAEQAVLDLGHVDRVGVELHRLQVR